MKRKSISLRISADIGKVSAISLTPDKCMAVLTMAHGAGAGMTHPFMEELATSLAEANIATLRFNFPYMENKKGRPDNPVVAHKTIAIAMEKAQTLFPGVPLFASGKSFGGRMTSQYVSGGTELNVKGIIFYGFPLHAPGKASIDRADHLKNIKIPMLFLQGSRDEFAEWDLIKKVCGSLRKSKLIRIEGANHSFKAGKINTIEILVNETKKWIEEVMKKDAKREGGS